MRVIEIPEYQPKPIDPFATNGAVSYVRQHVSEKPVHYENKIQRLQDITVKPNRNDAPAVHSNVTINLHIHYKGTEYQSQPTQDHVSPRAYNMNQYHSSPLSSLLGGHKYAQTAPAMHYIAQQTNPLYETKSQKDISYRYNTSLGNRCAYCTCHRKYE